MEQANRKITKTTFYPQCSLLNPKLSERNLSFQRNESGKQVKHIATETPRSQSPI